MNDLAFYRPTGLAPGGPDGRHGHANDDRNRLHLDRDADGTVLFDIAKHRNGATDEVIAAYSMRRGIFSDLLPARCQAGFTRLPESQFSH